MLIDQEVGLAEQAALPLGNATLDGSHHRHAAITCGLADAVIKSPSYLLIIGVVLLLAGVVLLST